MGERGVGDVDHHVRDEGQQGTLARLVSELDEDRRGAPLGERDDLLRAVGASGRRGVHEQPDAAVARRDRLLAGEHRGGRPDERGPVGHVLLEVDCPVHVVQCRGGRSVGDVTVEGAEHRERVGEDLALAVDDRQTAEGRRHVGEAFTGERRDGELHGCGLSRR